jgi:hypothetical protein
MKEGGADAERKGKLKVEDLKINTVFNMHCEKKKYKQEKLCIDQGAYKKRHSSKRARK